MSEPARMYTTGEVASLCGVTTATVRLWVDRGILKGFRLPKSNHRRVSHEELQKFMAENAIPLR